MAYVNDTTDNENNSNPSQTDEATNPTAAQSSAPTTNQPPPSTSAGGGSSGVVSAGSTTAGNSSPAASPKPSSSGSWTNLDQYLNANADQATGVGQAIASTVNAAGNQAQTDINNLGTSFDNAVQSNVVNSNPNAVNQAITDATSLGAGQTLSNQDLQNYQQQADANYTGPTDVTQSGGYSQAQQDINTATQDANETQSEAGRGTLLNNQYANSSQYGYTQGENNLDQLLLQNSSGAQAALQPLAQQWSGLTSALGNTVQSGDATAQQAIQTNQATANAAQNALSTANTNFQNELNTGLANLQQTDTNAYNSVLTDLESGRLSPQDYTNLGINPSTHIYTGLTNGSRTGVNLPTYLTEGVAPTLSSYATADQYAQAAALAQLAGQSSSSYLAPDTLSQAGTAENAPAYTFNNSQFTNDNNTQQAEYNQNMNNILGTVNKGFVDSAGGPIILGNNGQPFNSIPQAVQGMENFISQYGNQNEGYAQAAQYFAGILAQINQAQQAVGLPIYSTAIGQVIKPGSETIG